jgi:hypothetical protein
MFAFTSAGDMMRALSEAFSIMVQLNADQPQSEMGRGRYLRDLHLEPGDVVMAATDDFPLGVHLGSSYRVGRHPQLGFVVHLPMATVDRDYLGACFVVVHRAPQKVAL